MPPVTSLAKVPQGWMGDDTDLDPDDIDANIERIERRIQTAIMPGTIQVQAKTLQKADEGIRRAHAAVSRY
ncbi:uncharacterized protein N7469_001138 [Penicillium citrinum]|uniref:Uncharacterized protein n=1 Tax=Penicillium citrinum TaxID=5077 RepID=A0A9W9PE89_PENCI|nr:uncharacterized protein N7469_001138 [Penicillium citrinum]KAJ5242811.1 hypothetical protein N7469_001138 [Penicillium citrinum]